MREGRIPPRSWKYTFGIKNLLLLLQSEGLWEGIKREVRVYLHDRQIIRKLYKEGRFYSPDESSIDLDMSRVPNKSMPVRDEDLVEVFDRISGIKSDLAGQR